MRSRSRGCARLLSGGREGGLTHVFDRALFRRHRERAVALPDSAYFDYLRIEMANRMVDRLDDITRRFPMALDLSCHRGHLYRAISANEGIGGIEHLVQCDFSENAIAQARLASASGRLATSFVVADEEALPFPDQQFDLVLSSLGMHWVNEIPALLAKIKAILRPDGAFIGCMIGGNSLLELRSSLYLAELERRGGMSPHTSPMVQASDVAGLMQASGLALPTVDVDTITVGYPSAFALMEHLRSMGEGSAATNRQASVGADTFLAAASIYQHLYGLEDGSVSATFQVISVIGWSPSSSQPSPKKRGSAQSSFRELQQSK